MEALALEIKNEDPTFEYDDTNRDLRIFEWYHGKTHMDLIWKILNIN